MSRITERELSYLSFSALAVVNNPTISYRKLHRLLKSSPAALPSFKYPLKAQADRVLRELPKASRSRSSRNEKARGPWGLASYLVNWAEQQGRWQQESES